MPNPETALQTAICEYLAWKKHFFWRQNNAPVYQDGRFYSLPKFARRGVPDIIVVQEGQFIGLEVKTKSGKQSPEQRAFQEDVERAGGRYHVVRSATELEALGL